MAPPGSHYWTGPEDCAVFFIAVTAAPLRDATRNVFYTFALMLVDKLIFFSCSTKDELNLHFHSDFPSFSSER